MSEIKQRQSQRAQRANRIFEEHVRPALSEDADPRAYVAIDMESKDYEVDRKKLTAADRLVARHPEAKGRLWFRRVGSPVAYHIGGRLPREGETGERP